MARQFHLIRKRYSSLEKNIVLAEELIEAGGFVVIDGNLLFFNDSEEMIIATPAGTWLEVEEVFKAEQVTTDNKPGIVIEGDFNGHSEHAVRS